MQYFSNLFDKAVYMFRTCPLSIIRSISTVYTRNRYLSFQFCWCLLAWSGWIQCRNTPDDGTVDMSETCRVLYQINMRNSASRWLPLSLILRRSRTGTVWFYTSTSNKRATRPKLYTKSLTRDLNLMYSRLTLVRISIKL
jgi:hypothetical protein